MNWEKQRRIEQRAYTLWQAEGQPHGKDEEHWLRAAREIEAEETVSVAAKRSLKRTSGRRAVSSGSRSPQRKNKAG
jgi:Protein of unknown function (DUF2934)